MVYRSMTITSNHVAVGHCSIATRRNYIVVDKLLQPRDTATSERMQSGSSRVQLHSKRPRLSTSTTQHCYRKAQPQNVTVREEHGVCAADRATEQWSVPG